MDAVLTNRLHPLVTLAAVAITVFSVVGVGAMTGIIPSSRSESAQVMTNEPIPAKAAVKAPGPVPTQSAAHSIPAASTPQTAPPVCGDCGTIESILPVETPGQTNGMGAVTGGVVGGLLGNQVGHGSGRTLATIIGVAGGAYAGHKAEEYFKKTQSWNVAVRMDDESYETVSLATQPSFHVGQKVKIINGTLVAN